MQDTDDTTERPTATDGGAGTAPDREWWKESVVYQVYPRSFNDSDGDGVGDLPGLAAKLDYIDALGVDVVWLNPVYESPNADNGYDISDYRAIMDEFGSMADWEAVLEGLHDRGMGLVMDLAVNHTSDEHEWFRRSRDPDSPYHDWYHWVEGDPDEPPNDWESFFGGPAWSYDEAVGKWYLHLFDEKQPDLNWRTPEVRDAVCEMVAWWLEKGIDGFRMDVINLLSKPEDYPDGEREDVVVHGADRFVNGPRLEEYLAELFEVLEGYDVMTVGEMVDLDVEEATDFVGPEGAGMSMAFNFDHMRLDQGPEGRWDRREWTLAEFREVIGEWQEGLHGRGWNSLFLGNHDQPRMVSRFGDDGRFREASAKLLATLLFTLEGTPFVYQGDEIGMTNYPWESLEEIEDVDTLRNVRVAREAGRFEDEAEMMALVRHRTRDNARTPMQWSDDPHAGFTDSDADPWLPVNPNYPEVNVEAARADPDSVWHHYRTLIDLRDEYDALVYGEYADLEVGHERVWAYERTLGEERVVVVLAFAEEPVEVDPDAVGLPREGERLLGNYPANGDPGTLRPYEARVYLD